MQHVVLDHSLPRFQKTWRNKRWLQSFIGHCFKRSTARLPSSRQHVYWYAGRTRKYCMDQRIGTLNSPTARLSSINKEDRGLHSLRFREDSTTYLVPDTPCTFIDKLVSEMDSIDIPGPRLTLLPFSNGFINSRDRMQILPLSF